jgi:hypothetical protein
MGHAGLHPRAWRRCSAACAASACMRMPLSCLAAWLRGMCRGACNVHARSVAGTLWGIRGCPLRSSAPSPLLVPGVHAGPFGVGSVSRAVAHLVRAPEARRQRRLIEMQSACVVRVSSRGSSNPSFPSVAFLHSASGDNTLLITCGVAPACADRLPRVPFEPLPVPFRVSCDRCCTGRVGHRVSGSRPCAAEQQRP